MQTQKTFKKLSICFTVCSLFQFSTVQAQSTVTEEQELPGNTSLPSSKEELAKIAALEVGNFKYEVEDYFERPKTSGFQFSPDGKYFSYREKDENGKRHIFVKNTETGKISKAIEEGKELIRDYGWANNNRLLYLKDEGGNENYHLFAANIDGGDQKALTPFDGARVQLTNMLKDIPDEVIIQMNKDNPQVFEPYKLNIVSGDLKKLYENTDMTSPIMGYDFDKNGTLRALTRQVNGTEYELLYRISEDSPFEVVQKTDWKSTFSIIGFDYEGSNPHQAYVITNVGRDKKVIASYDLKEKKVLEIVFENPTFDVGGLSRSRKRNYEIDYFHYEGEKSHIEPISAHYQKLHKKFTIEFKGKEFNIADNTDDESKYLLYVTSDKLYGEYYTYDVSKDKFTKILNLMPQLKEGDMAEMKSIKFKTRDGLTLYGYITLPKAVKKGEKVPLIVNPHGGPYGVRDSWGFNPETQLFASRGYATLQVNYRGSGGYGKEIFLAGSKQIGRKMLNDLEDAVAYVIEQGWVDKDKKAIYGGSYGGLATLGSLVKTPDLYSCGIDYVGVSNLFTFVNSFPAYWKPFMKQFYAQWYDSENPEEKKIMEEVSPALNTDKISKPLFVIQGANDPRVNINESDQIVETLRAKGFDVPYMVKYNEGHGFGHEENRIELYKTMMGFLARHLKGKTL
ncbi:S9 family peptidase [Xanthovirga aplysinae]|uniref:S9 family peptidase n=1 Tax=Xanthovirga aplysinae TaxID=2529853 RepID=UPI0012BD0105|nr:S9 family peptidase [Xanthovirga aplysinae]MTI30220.1 S9 family peptidase [Xanthovirga aplysinae]